MYAYVVHSADSTKFVSLLSCGSGTDKRNMRFV